MTINTQETQVAQPQTSQISDKEINFRKQQQMYERQIQEREARILELERISQSKNVSDDEDDDSEPYIDKKRLNKKLDSFGKDIEQKIDKRAEEKARNMLSEMKKQDWLEQTTDFQDIMSKVEDFAKENPQIAKNILAMPDTFERQQLVYHTIKSIGSNKQRDQESSIQQKIDANRKSPYYQPTGMPAPGYNSTAVNGEQAYKQMMDLKNRLRLG